MRGEETWAILALHTSAPSAQWIKSSGSHCPASGSVILPAQPDGKEKVGIYPFETSAQWEVSLSLTDVMIS